MRRTRRAAKSKTTDAGKSSTRAQQLGQMWQNQIDILAVAKKDKKEENKIS